MILTFKYRIKDSSSRRHLERHARACNFVWNYCCQIQRQAERRWRSGGKGGWPHAFDLIRLCVGSSKALGLHSETINGICRQFVVCRNGNRGCPRFRSSRVSRRSLGWVPFVGRGVQHKASGSLVYLKRTYRFWQTRELPGEIREGGFCQDARGRWYVFFYCDAPEDRPTGRGKIGIDLGVKRLATCSNGMVVDARRAVTDYEERLSTALRAGNKARARAIHAKIANVRRDYLHKWSSKIARENRLVVVGDVSPSEVIKKRKYMAKWVHDASWSAFRRMLEYKASMHRAVYISAGERMTSATCSDCGAVSGPKGIAELRVREWVCGGCGASHDRDVNAAINLLLGAERCPPAVGIASRARTLNRTIWGG